MVITAPIPAFLGLDLETVLRLVDTRDEKDFPMLTETAEVRRYLADDEHRFGIPKGSLVAVTECDYDDEKFVVALTLHDLRNPECSAYVSELGPALTTVELAFRDEEPWGYELVAGVDLSAVITAAEAEEKRREDLMARPDVQDAIQMLRSVGVTTELYATALRGQS